MAIQLNHTIVAARDKDTSATFLTEIFALPPPVLVGPFAVIQVGDTSLDYMNVEEYRHQRQRRNHFAALCFSGERSGIRRDLRADS